MTRIAKHTFAMTVALVVTALSFSEAATIPSASRGAVAAHVLA